MKNPRSEPGAFSLVELLCVISTIVFLATFAIRALQQPIAAEMASSGAHISALMEASRETAILTRHPVAVAMLSASKNTPLRFTSLKYVPGAPGIWQQLSKWESLPTGIQADDTADRYGNSLKAFQPGSSPQVTPSLPDLVYSGAHFKAGADYGYVIFLSDGSLFQDKNSTLPNPCILRLVEATKASKGSPANYFDIVLNDATGQTKDVRP